MIRESHEEIVAAVREACLRHYGDRLVSLAVFGSVARGTAGPDSDVDLLLVVSSLPRGRMARVAEFEAVERSAAGALERAARYGVRTSLAPVFKTPEEVELGSLLFLDMTDQARFLFDRERYLERYLAGFAERLRGLGAKRVYRRGGYYWLLKPDLRPGEELRL